jgi:predicted GH43/DUF377 family glycosyl hydrolase
MTSSQVKWRWGEIRGGTPAALLDDEYFAFFHSSINLKSDCTVNSKLHYFIGAYTFSAQPPFEVIKISPSPLIAKGMYTKSNYSMRVAFPGGYAVNNDDIYLAYGKDDWSIWIAKMSKKALLKSMISVDEITKNDIKRN